MHVHVTNSEGEAKFWLEPVVALAYHHKLRPNHLSELQHVIEERKNEISKAWKRHFRR